MTNRLSCPRVGFEYITTKRDCPLTGKVPDDITPDMKNRPSVVPSDARFIGIAGMPEITKGSDLAEMILNASVPRGPHLSTVTLSS